jgi:hypothetical protein
MHKLQIGLDENDPREEKGSGNSEEEVAERAGRERCEKRKTKGRRHRRRNSKGTSSSSSSSSASEEAAAWGIRSSAVGEAARGVICISRCRIRRCTGRSSRQQYIRGKSRQVRKHDALGALGRSGDEVHLFRRSHEGENAQRTVGQLGATGGQEVGGREELAGDGRQESGRGCVCVGRSCDVGKRTVHRFVLGRRERIAHIRDLTTEERQTCEWDGLLYERPSDRVVTRIFFAGCECSSQIGHLASQQRKRVEGGGRARCVLSGWLVYRIAEVGDFSHERRNGGCADPLLLLQVQCALLVVGHGRAKVGDLTAKRRKGGEGGGREWTRGGRFGCASKLLRRLLLLVLLVEDEIGDLSREARCDMERVGAPRRVVCCCRRLLRVLLSVGVGDRCPCGGVRQQVRRLSLERLLGLLRLVVQREDAALAVGVWCLRVDAVICTLPAHGLILREHRAAAELQRRELSDATPGAAGGGDWELTAAGDHWERACLSVCVTRARMPCVPVGRGCKGRGGVGGCSTGNCAAAHRHMGDGSEWSESEFIVGSRRKDCGKIWLTKWFETSHNS